MEIGRKVYLLQWKEEVTAVSRENTLLMMETLKSIVDSVKSNASELVEREKGMAKGDNEMVWVEETALYCSVRMRKGCGGQ